MGLGSKEEAVLGGGGRGAAHGKAIDWGDQGGRSPWVSTGREGGYSSRQGADSRAAPTPAFAPTVSDGREVPQRREAVRGRQKGNLLRREVVPTSWKKNFSL